MRYAFAAVLAAIVATNAVNLVENARKRPYQCAPRSTYALAKDSPSWSVKGTFAIYQFLRLQLPPHAHLRIPPDLAWHAWYLDRLSHLEVEMADAPIWIDDHQYDRLHLGEEVDRDLVLDTGGDRRRLRIFIDRGADRYVIAAVEGKKGPYWVLLSEGLYRRVAR